ncbi:hypothetical protein EVAR_9210_1 [Eumeta japonica]|uniref:FLYWCH-type domain-containing protein n=1 Tax=Eumeta variegata TaxID=151549 RepID=A0A4C1WLJ3_EUMVA|nr:hypothetical protein EVAR_9210_1 [Eumeta japonica]
MATRCERVPRNCDLQILKVTFVKNFRGRKNPLLMLNGFTYSSKNDYGNGRRLWYCSRRYTDDCKASVISNCGHYQVSPVPHNHDPPQERRTKIMISDRSINNEFICQYE